MKTRRLAVASLALVAALSVGVAGCNTQAGSEGSPAGSSDSPAAKANPADELAAAVRKLNEDTFTIRLKMSVMSAEGAMDPAAKKANLSMKMEAAGQSIDFKIILLDPNLYLKYSGVPGMPKEWMRIDSSKIKDGSSLDIMPEGDPMGANNLVKGIVAVERDGDLGFKGTLDLTKSPTADAESMKMFGEKVKAVPFTAKVDSQGRLVEMSVDTESVSPMLGEMRVSYDNFGKPVEITAPKASDVVEMPDSLLGLMDA
jgi:hypothetical protein